MTLDLYGHGTPQDLADLDAEMEKLGLTACVRRSTATADEMRRLYSDYDALLFTSAWGEPFALTPLEAGASGLPVISSLDGGQAELVQDGVNSIAANAGDSSSFAAGITRLAGNQELRSHIASNALVETRSRFDLETIVSQIEEFILPIKGNS